jgi:hypothetical protein
MIKQIKPNNLSNVSSNIVGCVCVCLNVVKNGLICLLFDDKIITFVSHKPIIRLILIIILKLCL